MRMLFQALAALGIARFAKDESGATAIEYALIAVGLSIAIIVTVFAVGDELDVMYQEVIDDYLAQRGN